MADLLSVLEAQSRIKQAIKTLPTKTVDLADAYGKVLATDIQAEIDLPPFANSSMDGFAVRAVDTQQASQSHAIKLTVTADIPAGTAPAIEIKQGEMARIMTGAPLPAGADAVVPVEDTSAGTGQNSLDLPSTVDIYRQVAAGTFVRPAGQDIHKGQTVLKKGRRLLPQDVGMLASLGFAQVPVYHCPKVAILSTGDELVSPSEPLAPGKIRDSNSYSIGALLAQNCVDVVNLGFAPDQPEIIRARLQAAVAAGVDLILTSAGVSVGAYDYVRAMILEHGELNFWRVNMRPGKPVAFGNYEGIPLIGLPGNPVSAFVGFLVFVVPALDKMSGVSESNRMTLQAILSEAIESDGRESYLRAIVRVEDGKLMATLTGHQGSGNLFSLVQANALLIVPSGVKSLPIGAQVNLWLLNNRLQSINQ
jgi:molybdopterin molybdotransferase